MSVALLRSVYDELKKREINPVIINSKSRFVVVSYYWGHNNKSVNTQRPCPALHKPGTPLDVQPVTYGKVAKRWISYCRKAKCNYLLLRIDQFEKKGMYQTAINFKPFFIDLMLKKCGDRGVLYIDTDMNLLVYPSLLDTPRLDCAMRSWMYDVRDSRELNAGKWDDLCFDPWILETSGGMMYFANSPNARSLIVEWKLQMEKQLGKADDRVLSVLFNRNELLLSCSVMKLPIEYLWLNMIYSERKIDTHGKLMIEHPECITEEELAEELGADGDRYPVRYDQHVSKYMTCMDRKKKLYFFEYAYFAEPAFKESIAAWLAFMHKNKFLEVIPYEKQYGPFQSAFEENEKLKLRHELDGKDTFVLHVKEFESLHSKRDVIPMILRAFEAGHDTIVHMGAHGRSINHVNHNGKSGDYDLVAKNTSKSSGHGKRMFTMALDWNYPIFFGHQNEVLLHLLRMSRSLDDFQKIFNSSYMFLHRLRILFKPN